MPTSSNRPPLSPPGPVTPSSPTRPADGPDDLDFSLPGDHQLPIPDLPTGAVLRNRYRIQHSLGKGGFGGVYLALDLNLSRKVAIKRQIGRHLQDAELAQNEAKFIAGLDHPSIVKVYDLIDDPDEGVLIIMEYVNGFTLHELLRRKRLAVSRALALAVEIAAALVHAHSRRIVHRDLKPSNVLLDQAEKVKLSDFGLALGEINFESAPSAAGTPKYMAPEQIRGESHRIDGRTDLWSLGVILYEMLTGYLPFSGPSRGATFEAILHDEPIPVRQLNPHVPDQVEHLVDRCLRKRMSERPVSAADLLDDLKACQEVVEAIEAETGVINAAPATQRNSPDAVTPHLEPGSSRSGPLRVEAKGLRPYTEEDGVLFLDLIPGPRERTGLPESIHFWKRWASCDNIDEHASVGVLYGASGAGKTSFVRAGLINQLEHDICPIVIECKSGDLSKRIEAAIRGRFRHKSAAGSLSKLLSGLRGEEGGIFGYRKILLILDQFESWSAAATTEERRALAEALRHCDGKSLQCLFVVRDDYWSGITEIMQWIDVPLVENRNVRSLEMMDVRHAQRVLEGIGRAHGTLPKFPSLLSDEQQRFIAQAAAGLANNERVVAVHMVMFAQIVRVLPWTPSMLRKQGGVEGACAAYLHEIFETPSGPPAYRRLAGVVAEILSELLPPRGSSLKASAKSAALLRTKMLAGAGARFPEALRILSEDLRLITPTRSDPGAEVASDSESESSEGYQLAHDFLIEPVRNWVELARKSTWRGRVAAKLAELSELWLRRPENQFLPTFREYAAMQLIVPSSSRNEKQAKFLRAAGRYHAGRAAATLVAAGAALIFALLAFYQYRERNRELEARVNTQIDAYLHGPAATAERTLDRLAQTPSTAGPAARNWIDSVNPKVRARAALLAAKAGEPIGGLEKLVPALDQLEVELLPQLIALSKSPEAKAVLGKVFNDPATLPGNKARAAIVLLYAGDDSAARAMLKTDSDLTARDALLHEALTWRASPQPWAALAMKKEDVASQYGAFAILSTFKTNELVGEIDWKAVDAMRSSADWAQCALSEWLMTLHGVNPDRAPATPPADANWTRNSVGIELRKMEPGSSTYFKFKESKDGAQIGFEKPLWVSVSPVTRKLLGQFLAEFPNFPGGMPVVPPGNAEDHDDALEQRPNTPARFIPIDTAIAFCNWLSRKERLSEAYQLEKETSVAIAEGIEVKHALWKPNPDATGYRLLNEQELAYAMLAGAVRRPSWALADELNTLRDLQYPTPKLEYIRLDRETIPNVWGLFLLNQEWAYWIDTPQVSARFIAASKRTAKSEESAISVEGVPVTLPAFMATIIVARP